MDYIIYGAVVILSFVTGLFVKNYFPSYFSEKGKNLATKEDINEITRIVEQIKVGFSKDLEFVKWQLGKKATIHKLVAEKEINAISEISSCLFDLNAATSGLTPIIDSVPKDELEKKEMYESRYKEWAEKHNSFLATLQKNRLFIPKDLYIKFLHIKSVTVDEGTNFEYVLLDGNCNFNRTYYKESRKNIESLTKSIDELSDLIHQRYEIEGLTNPKLQ